MNLDHQPEDSDTNAEAVAQPVAHATDPKALAKTGWASARQWLYVVIIFLTGVTTANPTASDVEYNLGDYGISSSQGYYAGQVVGAGFGALLVSFTLAALLMGWRRSTRRLMPGTACVIAILSFLGRTGREAAETDTQISALRQWTASPDLSTIPKSDPPPKAHDARVVWARRKALQDIADHERVLEESHGIDPQTAPAAWLTAPYLADAGKHPEVREYFTRYQGFLRERDSTYLPVLAERTEARLRGAGLPRWEIEEIMLKVRNHIEESSPGLRRQTADQLATAAAALELHAYLERVDPRVHLEAATGNVRFANEAERTQAFHLANEVERLAQEEQRSRSGPAEK